MTQRAPEGTKAVLYVRLSRDDAKSMSIENQSRALQAYAPDAPLVIDRGVSGETNLTYPKSNWNQQVRPILQADPSTQVVIFTLDRMGRKKGAMMYEAEKIIDGGSSIYCVRDGRLFDDMDDAAQAIEIMMGSYNADAQRVEGRKKTIAALEPMKAAGIPLGRKPELTEADLATIRALRAKKLGYTSIGKALSVKRKRAGGVVEVARSPKLIKLALSGRYETREAYERRDLAARKRMAAHAVLGEVGEELADA